MLADAYKIASDIKAIIPHLYDRDLQLDERKLKMHCKEMIGMINPVKQVFDAISQGDYINHGEQIAGMLYHYRGLPRDAAYWLADLHQRVAVILDNAGEYREHLCGDGVHVVRPFGYDGRYEKISVDIDYVKCHADKFMDSLPK